MDFLNYMKAWNRRAKKQKEEEEEDTDSNSPYLIAQTAYQKGMAINQPLKKAKPKKADSEQEDIGESPAITAFNKQLKALNQTKKTRKKKKKVDSGIVENPAITAFNKLSKAKGSDIMRLYRRAMRKEV